MVKGVNGTSSENLNVTKQTGESSFNPTMVKRSSISKPSSSTSLEQTPKFKPSGTGVRSVNSVFESRASVESSTMNKSLSIQTATRLLESISGNTRFTVPQLPNTKKFTRDVSIEYVKTTNREFMGKSSVTMGKTSFDGTLSETPKIGGETLKGNPFELMSKISEGMDESRQKNRTGEQTTVSEKINQLKSLNVETILWSNQKGGVSMEAGSVIKELRTQAIMEPAAKMTALDIAKSLQELPDIEVSDVKEIPPQSTGIKNPLAGREYNFEIKYTEKGEEKSLKLFFHAPGSNTDTSDIDLGIKTIPPNMFAQAWLKFDKNANECLEGLRSDLKSQGIKLGENLAKAFDINLYSSGFIFDETAKKSVFSPHTELGLKQNMVADIGLGMIRSVENVMHENDFTNKSGMEIKQVFDKAFPINTGDYGKSKNLAINSTLQNMQDMGREILEITKGNDSANFQELKNLLDGMNYDCIESFKKNIPITTKDYENLAKLNTAIGDIKKNHPDIFDSAVKANFLKTHSEVINLSIEKSNVQSNLHDISQDHLDSDVKTISSTLIPQRKELNKLADDISLKALISQGRGTTFADEAYNNASALHKTVEGRQMGLTQFNSPMGALGSVESDFGFINHHHEKDLDKFLLSSGKYLSRFMDQSDNVKLKDWGGRNIDVSINGSPSGKKVSAVQLQNWARKLEQIKNGQGDFKEVKTNEAKLEMCKVITKELFGTSEISPDDIKKIISDVRSKVVTSISQMSDIEKFQSKI